MLKLILESSGFWLTDLFCCSWKLLLFEQSHKHAKVIIKPVLINTQLNPLGLTTKAVFVHIRDFLIFEI